MRQDASRARGGKDANRSSTKRTRARDFTAQSESLHRRERAAHANANIRFGVETAAHRSFRP